MVPYREEMAKRHLKPTGDLGRVNFVVCDDFSPAHLSFSNRPRNTTCATPNRLRRASVTQMSFITWWAANFPQSECDRDLGVELVIDPESRNFSYTDVHVDGVERIAEAVAKYDVDRFIHVSSYNAKRDSSSEYFATKVGSFESDECGVLIPDIGMG